MKPSDINIDKLKSGDEHEFRLLFDLLYPRMMSVACRFVSEDAAEDVVHLLLLTGFFCRHIAVC